MVEGKPPPPKAARQASNRRRGISNQLYNFKAASGGLGLRARLGLGSGGDGGGHRAAGRRDRGGERGGALRAWHAPTGGAGF